MNHSQKPNPSTATDLVKSKSFSQSKHAHWKPIVSAWRDSDLSQSAFCRKNDLNFPQFSYWRIKVLGKTNKGYPASTARPGASPFVPVQTSDNPSEAGLRVNLPNGIILSGIDEQQKQINLLEEQLRLLRQQRYGKSSEKNTAQGELFNEVEQLSDQGETEDSGMGT